MAAAQPRNTSPSSLLSSSSDETFVAARLRKYSPPRSLSFRFLPCPALSTMLPIFPCSARISSSCVSARSNRKSGYPHTHTRTRLDYAIECTAHVPPPRSRDTYYKFKLYLWPPWTAPFSCCYFFFFHRTTPTERIYIYVRIRETDVWIVFRMSTKPHSQKRQSEQERGGVGVRVPRGIRILPSSPWLHPVLRVRVWRSFARVLHGRIDVQVIFFLRKINS